MYFDRYSYVAIIPSYNEAQTLPNIIREILKKNIQVIVIDDHSTDNSYKHLQNSEIIYLRNSKRLGYEKSLNRGFRIAKKKNYKYLVTFDADGQLDINDISRIFKKLILGKNMLVVGERNKKQRVLEYLFSIYTSKFFKINDPLSGLKAINLKKIRLEIDNKPFNYTGTNVLIQCITKNLKHDRIKINMNKRIGKSRYGNFFSSNIKILKSFIYFIYNHLKI